MFDLDDIVVLTDKGVVSYGYKAAKNRKFSIAGRIYNEGNPLAPGGYEYFLYGIPGSFYSDEIEAV